MGCGCGGKKFSGARSSGTSQSVSRLAAPAPSSQTLVQATGVKLGTAPVIQPMQRKTV